MNIEIEKNNPNFYYLIGLISTDGNIRYPKEDNKVRSYHIRIGLQRGDIDVLNKIKLLYGGSIYHSKTRNYSVWGLSDKNFIEYLKEIGLTNRKTYNLDVEKWFNSLNNDFKLHFLRGCWDGDGSINIYDRICGKTKSISTHICSASYKFIKLFEIYFNHGKIKTISKDKQNSYNKDIKATVDLYYYHLNGKHALKLKPIYNNLTNTSLFISRKYENWLKILDYYTNHIDRFRTSNYYGASYCKATKTWNALIKHNNIAYLFAGFPTDKDAAIAYDICTIYFNICTWKVNFPKFIDTYKNILNENSIDLTVIKNVIPKLVQMVELASDNFKNKKLNKLLYKGISKQFNKFICYIHYKNKSIKIKSYFNTELEAAKVRDTIYYYLYGDAKKYNLNFPEKISDYKSFDKSKFKHYFTKLKYDFIFN